MQHLKKVFNISVEPVLPFPEQHWEQTVLKTETEVQLHLLPLIKDILKKNSVSKKQPEAQCICY